MHSIRAETQNPTITLPTPHQGQRPELLSPARFKLSVHGRRWGKSLMGLVACIAGHGTDRVRRGAAEGGTIWWVGSTRSSLSIIWRLLREATRHAHTHKDEVERRIELPGGGSITVKPSDSELRGEGLDGVVVDEAAFLKEAVWYEELRAALSDKLGWAWLITTPNGQNWLWKLFNKSEKLPNWARWQGPTTEATVPPSELEEARRELGHYAFRQEYLAEFVQPGGDFFKREYFAYWQNGGATYRVGDETVELASCKRFSTVDLAVSTKTSADYTAVATFAVTPKKRLMLLDLQRVRMEGPDQVPLLRRIYDRWSPRYIAVERTAYQLALVQAARREGLPVRELKPDRDKIARACLLQARLEGGSVYFPPDAPYLSDLEEELLAFPDGAHDDQVDVLSYGCHEVANQREIFVL